MTVSPIRSASLAGELRREFDHAFAVARDSRAESLEDFLAIRVGGDAYAIPLAEIAGIAAGRPITGLPETPPECLGIASVRGVVVPVYDLRLLLGYPAGEVPRWLMVVAVRSVALAFDAFDGHLRIPSSAIAYEDDGEDGRSHRRGVLRTDDYAMPIVGMASILDTILTRVQRSVSEQER